MTKMSPIQKFFHKCDNLPVDSGGCKFYFARNDYPRVRLQIEGRGKVLRGNRLILERSLGRAIQTGYFACHICDNRGCVNPAHIYEGTPKQNTQDAIARGRFQPKHWKIAQKLGAKKWSEENPHLRKIGDEHWSRKKPDLVRKGERHHKARLSEYDVKGIRTFYSMGILNQYELAEKYNVSQNVISRTIRRKLWGHVA